MQYAAKESIDAEEVAQKLGRSKRQITSLINHAANNDAVYAELRESGYAELQIPAWVAKESHRRKRQEAAGSGRKRQRVRRKQQRQAECSRSSRRRAWTALL